MVFVSRITAIKERKKALAGSVVKIAGRDVMLSKKIMISIVMVPLLWLFYAVLLMLLTSWNLSTKVIVQRRNAMRATVWTKCAAPLGAHAIGSIVVLQDQLLVRSHLLCI